MSKSERPAYKIADLSLAEFGRRELRLAEQEMPGLMALRERNSARNHWPLLATGKNFLVQFATMYETTRQNV